MFQRSFSCDALYICTVIHEDVYSMLCHIVLYFYYQIMYTSCRARAHVVILENTVRMNMSTAAVACVTLAIIVLMLNQTLAVLVRID